MHMAGIHSMRRIKMTSKLFLYEQWKNNLLQEMLFKLAVKKVMICYTISER